MLKEPWARGGRNLPFQLEGTDAHRVLGAGHEGPGGRLSGRVMGDVGTGAEASFWKFLVWAKRSPQFPVHNPVQSPRSSVWLS